MPNFGAHTGRPGGEPPPRRQLTPEEIHIRENFNRAEHLRNEASNQPPVEPTRAQVPATFDEGQIRAALAQVGLDLCIFPLGEKPADPTGRNQYREGKFAELENQLSAMRTRATQAESVAATAIREVGELAAQVELLQVANDTLSTELELLKQPVTQEAT